MKKEEQEQKTKSRRRTKSRAEKEEQKKKKKSRRRSQPLPFEWSHLGSFSSSWKSRLDTTVRKKKGEETVIRREGEAEGGLKESIFRLGKIRCLRPVEKGSRAVGIVTRSSAVTLT